MLRGGCEKVLLITRRTLLRNLLRLKIHADPYGLQMILGIDGGQRRLLPLVAPLALIAGALAGLAIAGLGLFAPSPEYIAGGQEWSPGPLLYRLLPPGRVLPAA